MKLTTLVRQAQQGKTLHALMTDDRASASMPAMMRSGVMSIPMTERENRLHCNDVDRGSDVVVMT